jgi:hypothetical protein
MLDTSQAPNLIVTEKNAAHVYGACSLCDHRLHAFIRGAEEEAMLLLNRGFKHHCRMRHEMIISIPTKISTPRRSTRVAADVAADILIDLQGERFAYAGETVTVNLHGALVRIAAPAPRRITFICAAFQLSLHRSPASASYSNSSYSNSSITISGFDPNRSGGPQVPAPLEVKTCIFPIRLKP